MKRKSSKYLEFYKECMKTGVMPTNGLCYNFPHSKILDLFVPFYGECEEFGYLKGHWCVKEDHEEPYLDAIIKFNPLRQTIVLFMHEIYLQQLEENNL